MFFKFVNFCGVLGALCVTAPAAATDYHRVDRPGGRDHPIVSRYQGSVLYMYGLESLGVASLVASDKGKPALRTLEGRISNQMYWAPKGASALEVFRNYQHALRAAGFDTLYQCETAQCEQAHVQELVQHLPGKAKWVESDTYVWGIFNSGNQPGFHYISARKTSATGTVHVQVALAGDFGGDSNIEGRVRQFVQVVETAQAELGKVTVDAKAIGDALQRDGKIALYGVLFDTGKASIKDGSSTALQEMAKALNATPALKVFIVGHTDNQGGVDANLGLSQKRAEAVVEQLKTRYGIAPARLEASGVANYAPVGSNANEDGRAKNRRVEMVVR
jgi:OOP family OmpA-OmpF porin